MFYGNRAFANPKTRASELMRGCRIAMELGADALKIPYIDDLSVIDKISHTLKLPIYLLGGSRTENHEQFLEKIQEVSQRKIAGLMFGRNIWQSENMEEMVHKIIQIIKNSSD